jgi:hypothetical protein
MMKANFCKLLNPACIFKSLCAIVLILNLFGCATALKTSGIPDGYVGDAAYIDDFVYQESSAKGRIFAVDSINGEKLETSFERTRRASAGSGFGLTMVSAGHSIVAGKPLKFSLRASHVTAAPIHAMFSSVTGNFFSIEKEVTFTPEANKKYIVKGILKKDASDVWIEDVESGVKVAAE